MLGSMTGVSDLFCESQRFTVLAILTTVAACGPKPPVATLPPEPPAVAGTISARSEPEPVKVVTAVTPETVIAEPPTVAVTDARPAPAIADSTVSVASVNSGELWSVQVFASKNEWNAGERADHVRQAGLQRDRGRPGIRRRVESICWQRDIAAESQ